MSVRDQDNLTGYKEKTAELLRKRNIAVGDTLTIRTSENEFTGILMPRYESASNIGESCHNLKGASNERCSREFDDTYMD